jgi:hypothetical protein
MEQRGNEFSRQKTRNVLFPEGSRAPATVGSVDRDHAGARRVERVLDREAALGRGAWESPIG